MPCRFLLQRQYDWSEAEFWAWQADMGAPVFASDDAREGLLAWAESREPGRVISPGSP